MIQRCAARNDNNPNNDNRNNGFRLVLSTFFIRVLTSLPEMPDGFPDCPAEVGKMAHPVPFRAGSGCRRRPDK